MKVIGYVKSVEPISSPSKCALSTQSSGKHYLFIDGHGFRINQYVVDQYEKSKELKKLDVSIKINPEKQILIYENGGKLKVIDI